MNQGELKSTVLGESNLQRFFEADRDLFRTKVDLSDFDFSHRLAHHPLFEPDALLALAAEMAKNPADAHFDEGPVRVDQRWNEVPPSKGTLVDLVQNIATRNGWILILRADKVPEYAKLLDECLDEIEDLSGRSFRALTGKRRAPIFISSPNRITSYHIDRECNWLLQIRGAKEIDIFDRTDREVLPESELERFWAVDNNAAKYKAHLQHRARTYGLSPGRGIHIPVNAPHWVRNSNDVSVSLSVNFHYRDALLGDVYRANYWLRRAGIRPLPPRVSPTVDEIKRRAFGAAQFGWRAVRGKWKS
jgi:hypothetical protein